MVSSWYLFDLDNFFINPGLAEPTPDNLPDFKLGNWVDFGLVGISLA